MMVKSQLSSIIMVMFLFYYFSVTVSLDALTQPERAALTLQSAATETGKFSRFISSDSLGGLSPPNTNSSTVTLRLGLHSGCNSK